ncbi:P2X purinoceptor 7 [Stylophora pistillata]|uniref:P2X purinoceptor 7 n=1 Tax=Stylophora pistillata TaxID=50429 RepID=A0A2B4R3X1_STYPI|nr:P2X purinoceptor 7 [Stylophora pistillata]
METDESIDLQVHVGFNAYGSRIYAGSEEEISDDQEARENTQENENEAIDPDGEVQLAREVQSVTQIEREDMAYLLRNVLAMGRGSLDFAKKLLQKKNAPPPPPPSPGDNSPVWCKCNACRPMPNEIENVCCKRVTCITRFQAFNNICLDRDSLEVCIRACCDIRADEFNFSMEGFRKSAYRQFVLWRFGKLGRGNRRVVPSCVVLSIRRIYPSADGQYMG